MPDDLTVTPGVGATVAADDVGGKLHQRVKISVGADGSATDLSSANPMPIGAPPSLPLPAGAATAANQATSNASLSSIDGKLPALASGRVPVDGSGVAQPVTDNGGSLTVDGTVALDSATLAALETIQIGNLPADPATASNQASANTALGATNETAPASDTAASGLNGRLQRIAQRLTSLLALLPASLGQKTKAASLAVTLASDQDALPVTGTFFQATQPISAAALPLPTGAAAESTLSALNTKIPSSPATDRTTAAAPGAVRLSDGAAFYKSTTPSDTQPISAASLPLPTGAATSANQATGNASLASLDTKTPTAKTGDFDTGAGTDTVPMLGLALPASGGAVVGGTSANPLRTDPTGTTTQPVSDAGGSLTVDGSVSVSNLPATQAISAASLPLPTGAATSAKQPALGTAGTASADVITVQGIAGGTAQPVSGTVAVSNFPADPATASNQATANTALGATNETVPASDTAASGLNGRLQRLAQRLTTLIGLLPTSLGQKASASSLAVVVASDQSAVATKEIRAASGTTATVAASASSVTLLASNANRLGATVYNDSSAVLYLKLGASASSTSFTLAMAANSYFEVPFRYTGVIDGVWGSATGNARVTELS